VNEGKRQSLHPEDRGTIDLWNFNILPQHYTASQPRTRIFIAVKNLKSRTRRRWLLSSLVVHFLIKGTPQDSAKAGGVWWVSEAFKNGRNKLSKDLGPIGSPVLRHPLFRVYIHGGPWLGGAIFCKSTMNYSRWSKFSIIPRAKGSSYTCIRASLIQKENWKRNIPFNKSNDCRWNRYY